MAKKRTGLQNEIAGIFSGVPIPKKGGSCSQPDGPAPKPDDPASKPGGSVIPKPVVAPQPQIPVAPTPKKPVEPLPAAPRPKVVEVKVPEQKTSPILHKVPRRKKDKLFAPKAGTSSARQKAGIVMFITLSVVLVVVLARPFRTRRDGLLGPGVTEPAKVGVSAKTTFEIDWPMPSVYPTDIRDPMELDTQQIAKSETPDELIVKGISHSEDRRYAIIGTRIAEEGDTIMGATISKINPNSVEFEDKDGKRWTQEVQGRE